MNVLFVGVETWKEKEYTGNRPKNTEKGLFLFNITIIALNRVRLKISNMKKNIYWKITLGLLVLSPFWYYFVLIPLFEKCKEAGGNNYTCLQYLIRF